MRNTSDTVDQARSTPNKKRKGLKLAVCMGLVLGGALLVMPTQQANAGHGCYSGYGYGSGYGGYGYSRGYSYPSYGSGGFYYSS
ncbi:MAG TPA: hypothetical protein DCY03_33475, partial [Planctomycetaceae bacterium]|nr:hypothetical protein [Planctomycetaceae bacterium]